MTKLSALATLAILACSASAHTIFQKLYVNGVDQGHLVGIRAPNYDGPLTDITSDDIICNGGIHPYHEPVSQAVIDVPAGATVTAEWHHLLNQTTRDPRDPLDPINPTHKGPIVAYLAKVNDATQTDVTELEWFKIYEDGLTVSTGRNGTAEQQWAADRLIANAGKVSFTIPACIASGHYLLRHEIIALYHASKYPGAEFYVECAQLNVVGGLGDEDPSETVSFPGAYNASDPGITLNIYDPNLTNYTIPGPALFSC